MLAVNSCSRAPAGMASVRSDDGLPRDDLGDVRRRVRRSVQRRTGVCHDCCWRAGEAVGASADTLGRLTGLRWVWFVEASAVGEER